MSAKQQSLLLPGPIIRLQEEEEDRPSPWTRLTRYGPFLPSSCLGFRVCNLGAFPKGSLLSMYMCVGLGNALYLAELRIEQEFSVFLVIVVACLLAVDDAKEAAEKQDIAKWVL